MIVAFDPRWSPQRSAQVGIEVANAWLTLNRLPAPDEVFLDRAAAGKFLKRTWLGVHSSRKGVSKVAVSVVDCDLSNRFETPDGWLIQAPGSFEDHSALGVLCHEFGHHVDYTLNPRAYSRSKVSGFSVVADEEEEVSRSEFNVHESFAEAIRLFITNPDLLRRGRPERWDHLAKRLRFRPLHLQPWQVVLAKAPRYVHRAVQAWLDDT